MTETSDTSDARANDGETDLAMIRREVGDVYLRSWRLTTERLNAYLAATRALVHPPSDASPPINDLVRLLDPDRNPALRPWEGPLPSGEEPDAALAAGIAGVPPVAATIVRHMPVADFASAHIKTGVCYKALAILTNVGPEEWPNDLAGQVRGWGLSQARPADDHAALHAAEVNFVESLAVAAANADRVGAAFEP